MTTGLPLLFLLCMVATVFGGLSCADLMGGGMFIFSVLHLWVCDRAQVRQTELATVFKFQPYMLHQMVNRHSNSPYA